MKKKLYSVSFHCFYPIGNKTKHYQEMKLSKILDAVGDAFTQIISMVGDVIRAFPNEFGISEKQLFILCVSIIGGIIGRGAYRHFKA